MSFEKEMCANPWDDIFKVASVASLFATNIAKAESTPFSAEYVAHPTEQLDNSSKCGEGKKAKCGEGKCGEGKKSKKSKCGEGKCGESKKSSSKKCGE